MIIYKDVFTGDEMFSDTCGKITLKDDLYYEVPAKHMSETTNISDAMIGGNASAEGGDEGETADPSTVSGLNVVVIHKLKTTSFNRESYTTYIKDYAKRLKAKLQEENPDRVPIFAAGMQTFIKDILNKKNFKKYEFYTGDSENPEGLVALLNWGEDENTPVFFFLKDGVVEEKV
ncbi:translationally-controlled tumor protein homolog [Ptychodera flava]|uniref:translationally-controlled tumor protein homolog n=1 Tax=Ptychodera flava TaxID=63121 RepID=UPI00396A8503